MKLYFLILWLSGSEPKELTFPTMRACAAYHEAMPVGSAASRCHLRESA